LKEEYRSMRETVLFEEEKTFLPELLAEAGRMKQVVKLEEKYNECEKKLIENDLKEDQLVSTQRATAREIVEQRESIRKQIAKLQNASARTAFRVAMKCPMSECRGFLSESFSCGLCSHSFCKSCHEKKEDGHECKPDQIETVKELEKSTKPCPKCYVRIYKTDGCDQMFCTQCRTPFSWKSGLVEEGVIHNPHYFEMMRAGEIVELRHRPADCEQMPPWHRILTMFQRGTTIINEFQVMYQQLVHHRQVTLVQLNRVEDYEKERLSYLTGDIEERKFKQRLYIRWQRGMRIRDERQIISTYLSVGEELFKTLTNKNQEHILEQLHKVKSITKQAIEQLDKVFQHKGILNAFYFSLNL